MRRKCMTFTALALLLVCTVPAPCRAAQVKLSNDIAWVMVSDSYKACVTQAYADASRRLAEAAKSEKPGSWCVVIDADETIISNVEFEAGLQAKGTSHSNAAWDEWCNQAKATALPGAKEFCARARELGGKVIIITNRDADVKAATLKNLDALGIAYDAAVFKESPYAMDRSKTMRRADLEKGALKGLPEGKTLPPLKILMAVGDQSHDLYNEKQFTFSDVKERFGKDLVIIPNPMYGEWQKKAVYAESSAPAKARAVEAAPVSAGAMTPQEAKDRIGQQVTVEGTVARVHTRDRGPDMLNFDSNWREGLSVAVFGKEKFGDLKASYEGKKIRVTGTVSQYRDASQIRVDDPSQISVASEAAAPAGAPAPAHTEKAPASAGAMTPQEAKDRIGQQVTVEGTVARVHTRDRGPDMLNFDSNWREGLSVAVFGKEKFGDLKASYEGKKIRVTGTVSEYRGAAQIKVTDPSQIRLAE